MMQRLPWVLCTAVALLTGCGSTDDNSDGSAGTGGQPDAGVDAALETSTDTGLEDTGTEAGEDASQEAGEDASEDASQEAGEDASEDVSQEAGEDAPLVDASTRPPGQCKQNSDCSGPNAECSMSPPGGVCLGCGTDSDCGNPLEFHCVTAACRKLCTDDDDCPVGMDCSMTNYCKLMSCGTGCPPPYVCSNNLCRRPECDPTPPECPSNMTCGQGNTCVEND